MSGPLGSQQWMYNAGAEFYDFPLEQSLRFEDGDTAYLSRTPSLAGNRKTWTWSAWVKRGNLGLKMLFTAGTSGSSYIQIRFDTNDEILCASEQPSLVLYLKTTQKFRDPSAWYHIVVAMDTTQATAADRTKLYVNGSLVTDFSSTTRPSQNTDLLINSTTAHMIGALSYGTSTGRYDGYMADVNFIDGQALDPTSFGEFKSGIWIPKDTSGLTFGTNGFRLAYADSGAIGDDTSGNTNDFTANNLVASDVVLDSPTNNFGGWMSEAGNESSGFIYSEGNKKIVAGSGDYGAYGNFFTPKSGKWYWEYCNTAVSAVPSYKLLGIASASIVSGNDKYDTSIASGVEWGPTGGTAAIYGIRANGDKLSISTTTAYGADDYQTSNDIVQVALDMDNLKVWFGINGVWQNSGDPVAGTNAAFTSIAEDYYTCMIHQWYPGQGASVNFGDDGTFHGSITAGGNSDANGYGDFKYAPPSGFLALCSANLPQGAIDTLADETPEDYFNTVLWTGDNTNNRSITGVGFQPSLVSAKSRSANSGFNWVDAVRGGTKNLQSNSTNAEATTNTVISFDSDGFTVGDGNGYDINKSGEPIVGWSWKANGAGVANTDGTLSSTVSVGATSQQNWFSIASYTGNATAGATIGHGLGVAPDMIIVKSRDNARDWRVYHSSLGSSYTMDLNTTLAVQGPNSAYWNSTDPTSSVFSVGSVTTVNGSGEDYISYCFANAEGLCRAGKYTGNGSTDGTFVYTGFRPAFILTKVTSTTNHWGLWDNKRLGRNPTEHYLIPNLSNAEGSASSTGVDFLSNGFKFRGGSAIGNQSGQSFVYLAIAEQPFKYANAR